MSDTQVTVAELKSLVQEFVDARDWRKFHDAKNLSMAIAIEAAELMEHFQWLTGEEASGVRNSTKEMAKVREELADVFAFAFSFANAMGIDVSDALRAKMVKNAEKYPAERFRGRFR